MIKKLLFFLFTIFMSVNMMAGENLCYTLTPASGSNNSYAGNCDIIVAGITWNLTGNSTKQPWRIGSKNLTGVDRELYSKTPITNDISKIEVKHGAASGITVNSFTLLVASDAEFNNIISTLTPSFKANDTIVIIPNDKTWKNAYYKFKYNVSVSGSNNKFVEFSEAKFYTLEDVTPTPVDSDSIVPPTPYIPLDTITCDSAKIAALEGKTDSAIVKGYVTAVPYNKGNQVSFWMADSADGGEVFKAYNAPYTSNGEVPGVGDLVWIKGTLTKYNSTPEMNAPVFGIILRADVDTTSQDTIVPIIPDPIIYNDNDTVDFTTDISDFNEWGNSYTEHILNTNNMQIVFESANHQTGTITNMPVTKGQPVEVILTNDNKYFSSVKFICKQWGTKSQTITLHYSIDGGENYLDFEPEITSDNFEITNNELPSDVNAVKITFSNASNQIGIEKFCFDLITKTSPATALDNTVDNTKPVKMFDNGKVLIKRDGKTYTVTGMRIE